MPVVGGIGAASEGFLESHTARARTYESGGYNADDVVDNSSSTADPIWPVLIDSGWTDCANLQSMAASIKAGADYVCTTASPCSHWSSSTISTITFVEGDVTLGRVGFRQGRLVGDGLLDAFAETRTGRDRSS